MAYQNKHDKTGLNSSDGEIAEALFREIAAKKGYEITEATKSQQFAHIDFLLEKDGKMWKIDCKSKKKLSRQDVDYNYEWCWLEINNVRGDKGWIFGKGHVAFEMEDHFIIVAKKDLIVLVEKLVDDKISVDKPAKAKYKVYRRFNRRDKITLIETKHLLTVDHSIWPKIT